jgi:dihydrofolate reductase
MVSVDVFFAGPEGELDWHIVDSGFLEYAAGMLCTVDTIFFGRKTYELMAAYWPNPALRESDPVIAEKMNSLSKIVFSKSLSSAGWENTRILREINPTEITELKMKSAKDLVILGSGSLVSAMTDLKLIDELRIIISPVILKKGLSFYSNLQNRLSLELLQVQTFASGVVVLSYKPKW